MVILAFLEENASALAAAAVLVAIVVFVWGALTFVPKLFTKSPPPKARNKPSQNPVPAHSPPAHSPPAHSPPVHSPLTEELLTEAIETRIIERVAQARHADAADKERLQNEIGALKSQMQEPATALIEVQARIVGLEEFLEHAANGIDRDRLEKARIALERGDYSLTDAIFADLESRRELEVIETARAAFGRGEIAEAEMRWADAAAHYNKAAQLAPSYDTLLRAGLFLGRAGDHAAAIGHEEQLVRLAKDTFGPEDPRRASALSNLAASYHAMARHDEAEPLMRLALAITRTALGKAHPAYAASLESLAELLRAMGRSSEAEPLFREALKIHAASLGKAHPDTQGGKAARR